MRTAAKIIALAVVVVPLTMAGPMKGQSAAPREHGVPASGSNLKVAVRPPAEVETQSGEFAVVIQVSANAVYARSPVTLSSTQLYGDCGGVLSWMTDTPGTWDSPTSGQNTSTFTVTLDSNGNALASLTGGPTCSTGTGAIVAQLAVPPHDVASTNFTIRPTRSTTPSLVARPSVETEDGLADVVAVMAIEFSSADAGKKVLLSSPELSGNCKGELNWYPLPGEGTNAIDSLQVTVTLDGKGNAYVVAAAGPPCLTSTSQIVAQLTTPPHTTFTTSFTIKPPGS